MNKSNIEYTDHTWNPITGCNHPCEYCYARKMVRRFAGDPRFNKMAKADYRIELARGDSRECYVLEKPMMAENGEKLVYPFGFEPTYHRYRVTDCTLSRLKMGRIVFVGAMGDTFGAWVPTRWIQEVLDACKEYPQHKYLFLTKNPNRYADTEIDLPDAKNFWYGTSITSKADRHRILALPKGRNQYLSIEPILEDMYLQPFDLEGIGWIIIGAETGNQRGKVIPKPEWITEIVKLADRAEIPVFMKDSLIPVIGEENMRRDYPEGMRERPLSKKLAEKIYGTCNDCHETFKKSEMYDLSARIGRGKWNKHFAYMCQECFRIHCKVLGVEVPEWKDDEKSGSDERG